MTPERVYLYGTANEGKKLESCRCPVCIVCWRVVGMMRCVHGGPYKGYVEIGVDPVRESG